MNVEGVLLLSLLFVPPRDTVRILVLGDLMPGHRLLPLIKRDPLYPFRGMTPWLNRADLTILNLECPLTDTLTPFLPEKAYLFHAPESFAQALRDAGIGGVVLANNHILDQGVEGLLRTLRALESAGIRHAGAGRNLQEARKPALFRVRGLTIGLLAYSNTFPKAYWATDSTPGCPFGHARWVREDVRTLRDSVDLILVSFHWGAERVDTPKTYQRRLARAAIRAGADLVFGHHPHVTQEWEWIEGYPVAYSLGNFAFGSYSEHVSGEAIWLEVFPSGQVRVTRLHLEVRPSVARFSPFPISMEEIGTFPLRVQRPVRARKTSSRPGSFTRRLLNRTFCRSR